MSQDLLKQIMAVVSIFLICLSISCNKDDEAGNRNHLKPDPLLPQPAITTTVVGVVIDENGSPVADAEVILQTGIVTIPQKAPPLSEGWSIVITTLPMDKWNLAR